MPFISFRLIDWLEPLVQCWVGTVRVDISLFVFFLVLGRKPSVSPLSTMLTEFFIGALYQVEEVPLLVCWVFLFFNQWKGTEFCQMLFLHQLRWSCVFFHSFCLCGYLDWFLYVKLHCTLRTNSTWSWSMILPILVASFCWGILYQCVPSSSISGKRLRIDISSLNVWYNSTVKSSFWYMPSSSSFTQWF